MLVQFFLVSLAFQIAEMKISTVYATKFEMVFLWKGEKILYICLHITWNDQQVSLESMLTDKNILKKWMISL